MRREWTIAAGLVLAAVAAPAAAENGQVLAWSCLNCHGPGGKSAGEIPALAGRTEMAIKTALIDFREGKRTNTVMTRLAKGYSDAEIDAVSKYLATLK